MKKTTKSDIIMQMELFSSLQIDAHTKLNNKKGHEKVSKKDTILKISIAVNVLLLLIVFSMGMKIAKDTSDSSAVEVQDFSLEEIDFSRIRENDSAYIIEIIAKADRDINKWFTENALLEEEATMASEEIIIEYLQDVYDALPEDCEEYVKEVTLRIMHVHKVNLESTKEDYERNSDELDFIRTLYN